MARKKGRHRKGGRVTPKGTRPPGVEPRRPGDRARTDDGAPSVSPLFSDAGGERAAPRPDAYIGPGPDDDGADVDGAAELLELIGRCLAADTPVDVLPRPSTSVTTSPRRTSGPSSAPPPVGCWPGSPVTLPRCSGGAGPARRRPRRWRGWSRATTTCSGPRAGASTPRTSRPRSAGPVACRAGPAP
jgi:hypothetical protein